MYKKGYLENGTPIVTETVAGMRSVSIGIWVKVGARVERCEKNGISHFIEHMFFKGTKNRTQEQIATEIDYLGGDLNAFTTRENTTYYVKVLKEHVNEAVDILTDIYLNSLFREQDILKEQEIISEEIKMVEDTPDDYIHDLFYTDIWGQSGLGLPVLGTQETVHEITRNDITAHLSAHYGTQDVVISCAGNINHEAMLTLFNSKIAAIRSDSNPSAETKLIEKKPFSASLKVYKKDFSEVHICMGIEGVKQNSTLRYPFLILNTIYGAGVSSRLFQEVREKRGLAYSIFSFLSSYADTGVFGVYAATGKKKYVEVIDTIIKEMDSLKNNIKDDELQRAKNQLKGNLLMGLESTSGRMQNIARQEIYYGRYYSPGQIIRGIERVKMKHVYDIIEAFIDNVPKAVTVFGPADAAKLKGVV
ncbi:MAG: insulinase family protein [Nitrospirae bacterium]|nr:insulinase family protein [Nitrospirota bacterium]MBF0535484.1 insulinase family protein [Nitrospirota bacterium]MBF0617384.1 insulinase family protein [Nitrospirota bacterium]